MDDKAVVLGIDPAFGKPSVYAVFRRGGDDARGSIWTVGEVATPGTFRSVLMSLGPDFVAVEKAWVGRNIDSALKLGRAIGWAEAAASERGIAFGLVHPATWKAWAGLPRSKRAPYYMHALLTVADAWTVDEAKGWWKDRKNADDYACAILIAAFAGTVLWTGPDGKAKPAKRR